MFSIIIITRNRISQLQKLISSLRHQELREHEVIVVDTGSEDGTREWLHSLEDVKLIELESRRVGFAESRNIGLSNARGDVAIFIDDDCIPEEDWMEKIVSEMEGRDAIGGVTLPPPELHFPWWWSPRLNWLVGLTPFDEEGKLPSPTYAQAANLALRRCVFEREKFQELKVAFSGERDELRLFRAGREDAELWWRLRVKGYRVALCPSVRVRHYISPQRLHLRYLFRRAFIDGRLFYLRQRQREYLNFALYQVFDLPTRLFRSLVKHKHPGIALHEFLWTVRQIGVLSSWLAVERDYIKFSTRSFQMLSHFVSSLTKSTARKVTVSLYRSFTRRKVYHRSVSRPLLLVCVGYIGDSIVIQPSIRLLKKLHPEQELHLLASPSAKALYPKGQTTLPVERIIALPPSPGEQSLCLRELLSSHYSGAVIFYYHNARCYELFFHRHSPPKLSYDRDVGFTRRIWYELLDLQLKKEMKQNEILNHRSLLGVWFPEIMKDELPRYELTFPEGCYRWVDEVLSSIRGKVLIGLSPGSTRLEKQWSPDRWVSLLGKLSESLGDVGFLLLGSKSEVSLTSNIASLYKGKGRLIDLAGLIPSLQHLGALLSRLSLLITTDSGVKHMAFALRVPTVTLYGPSFPEQWGPLWDRELHVTIRRSPPDLTREELLGFPPNQQMLVISVEEVASETLTLLHRLNLI